MKGQLTNTSLLHTLNIPFSVAYLGGAMRPCPPPLGKSENVFLREKTYIFCSKCRKCRFRDPNFKNFPRGECPRTPLQWCRHYGIPLTKILATPLTVLYTDILLNICYLIWWIIDHVGGEWNCHCMYCKLFITLPTSFTVKFSINDSPIF